MATQERSEAAIAQPVARTEPRRSTSRFERGLFYLLATMAIVYGFLAGLKTIAEFDLGWQMATGRWIVQHHQIPSVEVFSYTAAGQPWIYPVGAGLIFYGAFLLGGYALISWLAASACAAVVAILVRRRTVASAALAILAVPLITARTTPRAEMFTVMLFAATLSLLWQQHERGNAKLWLLPILMAAWVNLHPGFISGLGLLGAYIMVEALDMVWPEQRDAAVEHLRSAWPWLLATFAATLINPWGWKVFQVIARQEAAMGAHSQLILEWAPIPFNWMHIRSGLSPLDPDEFYVLLLILLVAVPAAVLQRQLGAAILMAAAPIPALRHMRFTALFSIIAVVIGSSVITSLVERGKPKISSVRWRAAMAMALILPVALLAVSRTRGIVTNRTYLAATNLVSFGTGLSWWFPEKAAAFVERENLPGQIFSTGSEGAFMIYRLGPKYKDYIDGRAIPFGTDMMLRSSRLKAIPPDSPEWKQEIERYDINVILIPIGRFSALQFFPMLKQFCQSDQWRPVYLDEVSVVFLRRRPETEDLIRRLQIDCLTAPLPAGSVSGNRSSAFNQWANAASVLHALGRDAEATNAVEKALNLVPASGYLYFLRGHIYEDAGNLAQAERDYLHSTRLEPNLVAPWSALAAFYQNRGQTETAIDAWRHAADASTSPWEPLVSLGYADLQAYKPKDALAAFDEAAGSIPSNSDLMVDKNVLANIAHGRARSWFYLGDLNRAIRFDEQASRLIADPNLWMQLAALYDRAGRPSDANRVRAQASVLANSR